MVRLSTAISLALGVAAPVLGQSSRDAFVDVVAERSVFYLHEPIRIRLRFGFERAFFADRLIQMFRQQLDVPAQIDAAWIEGHACTWVRRPSDRMDGAVSCVVNGALAGAMLVEDRAVEGRGFAVFEIERTVLPTCTGELVLEAPQLQFAYATRFEQDVFRGRVPLDRVDGAVSGAPLALEIAPLPATGRPLEFTGAVGTFAVTAQASPRELAVGDRLDLTLQVTGEGNFELLERPPLDELEGFHVYGAIEDRGPAHCSVTYHLAPLSTAVTEVPAVPFAFFDPHPDARYRVVRTEPIELTVRPHPGGRAAAPAVSDEADIFGLKAVSRSTAGGRGPLPGWLGLAALPWVLALGLRSWLRVRARRAVPTDGDRMRRAAEEFRARVARGEDAADCFTRFLADCMSCSPAAVVGPDLVERLHASGMPAELASRASEVLDDLTAGRYGGRTSERGVEAAARVVEELEASL